MPQFNKELEEASKNYVQTIKDARELIKLNREYFEEINEKLVYELSWWDKTTAEQKLNDEYIIQIYKPLKRLINAYRQKEELQKESTKYSK